MSPAWHRVFWTGIAAAAIWGFWLLADGTRPYFRAKEPVLLDIERGARTRDIARRLEDDGVIRSRITFLALHYLRPGNTLKAGEYSFERPASPFEVLRKLIRGDVSYQVLVIPEGYNRFEIAAAVAAQGFSTRADFLWASEEASLVADLDPFAKTLEGYLFPDTYHFPRHARPAAIARAMVERFREMYGSLKPQGSARTIHDIVTMASVVEKETGLREERPVVAAVFYNRLQRRLLLQADPTVIYAAILENRYDGGKVRQSHLNSPSPYNTYVHRGLPPGPIANPGLGSIQAVIEPEPSEFFFFRASCSGDGTHQFARTLEEQAANECP